MITKRNAKVNTIKYNNIRKISKKVKSSNKKRKFLKIISFVTIFSFISFISYSAIKRKITKYYKYSQYEDIDIKSYNKSIEKNYQEESVDIQNYMDLVFNGTVLDKDKIYYPSKNPKISIVISVFNGEAYLKTAILSIQNQNLKDIEIVLVDDGSKDNSVNLIKELMKTEPRIVLYENGENKGTLYTKSKGVLNSKGKYVIVMDEDDIFVQRDAFSSIYAEAEKNNLDMLGYILDYSGRKLDRNKRRYSYSNKLKQIVYQPELSNIMYTLHHNGHVSKFGGSLVNHLVRTDLFKKVIKLIDEENMNFHMNHHEDYILFFLLTRNAKSIKYIERIFYICPTFWDNNEPKVKFRNEIKNEERHNKKCFAYLNFLDILFKNTKNTKEDKKIAFSQVKYYYLDIKYCRKNKVTREKAISVFKLYLENEYVSDEDKKKLRDFIDNPP
jgi:glycosyltransferase involved in cell wall biosynthesis